MYEADARAINTAILHLRCAIERELSVPDMHLGYGTFALCSTKDKNNKNNNKNNNKDNLSVWNELEEITDGTT